MNKLDIENEYGKLSKALKNAWDDVEVEIEKLDTDRATKEALVQRKMAALVIAELKRRNQNIQQGGAQFKKNAKRIIELENYYASLENDVKKAEKVLDKEIRKRARAIEAQQKR